MYDDAYTRNEDGELAVRTVNVNEGSSSSSYDDVFTRDENGKLALRVTGGGGGGDQHNLGYYATQAALEEAYPTAEAGDWAIVGATDTVWIWDTDNSEWVDSDQKGQVTSVNNQTGAVTLTASDVGAATAEQGAKADTAVQPADLATVATTGDYGDLLNKPTIPAAQVNSDWNANSGVAQILNKPSLATVATSGSYSDLSNTPTIPDAVQYSTMPMASVDNLGDIVQFIGTTDANYTNGYFYKCVSDGQDPATYSWERVDVQPSGGGGSYLPLSGGTMTGVIDFDVPSWQRVDILSKTTSGTTDGIIGATNIGIEIGNRQGGTVTICGNMTWYTAGYIFGDQYRYCQQMFVKTLNAGIDNGVNGQDIVVPQTGGTMAVIGVNTTATLAVADWSSNTQTVTVNGITSTSVVFVAPDPSDAADYAAAGILCTSQTTNSLTFTATTTPTNDIDVNIVCL